MYKKHTAALMIICCGMAGSVFANGFVSKLMPKNSSIKHAAVKAQAVPVNSTYTDFTGTWDVDCGEFKAENTVIENDAEHIVLDNQFYKIGQGLQGPFESNVDEVRQNHESLEWNEDRTALTMKAVEVSKDNFADSKLVTDLSLITLTMSKGQIHADGEFTLYENVSQAVQPTAIHCVLTRKQ